MESNLGMNPVSAPWRCLNVCTWIADAYGIKRMVGDESPVEITDTVLRLNLGGALARIVRLRRGVEERVMSRKVPLARRTRPAVMKLPDQREAPRIFVKCATDMILILDRATKENRFPLDAASIAVGIAEYTKLNPYHGLSKREVVHEALNITELSLRRPWYQIDVDNVIENLETLIMENRWTPIPVR
jgi:hypothetical protein